MPLAQGKQTYQEVEDRTFKVVRPKTYRVTLMDIEETQSASFRDPNVTEDKWIWRFEIDPLKHRKTTLDDGRPLPIQKWTGAFFNSRSKATEIAKAILGRDFKPDEDFDLNSLIGKQCDAVIIYAVDFKTKQVLKNPDGTEARNAIERFLPIDDDDDDEEDDGQAQPRLVGAAAVADKF